ncbi:MAG: hypothetical protein AAFR54_18055 [Planctomycetota bacterium]
MSRLALAALAALTLAPSPLAQTAQSPVRRTAQRIPSAAKFAGTYHVATRSFTRGSTAAVNFGTTDAIYAVTADTPYFTGLEAGEQLQDTGVIPGGTNPLVTGGRDDNFVTSFDFAYCDFDPSLTATSFEIDFHESAAPCTSLVAAAPTASFILAPLPAGGQCWVVNVDLTGGNEFCIGSDGGDGTYDFDQDLDSFGWAVRYTGGGVDPVLGQSSGGPIFAADPSSTDAAYVNPNGPPAGANPPAPPSIEGTGTYYNPLSGCTSAFTPNGIAKPTGSGLLNNDFCYLADATGGGADIGCIVFGGYYNLTPACASSGPAGPPFTAFYMEINAEPDCAPIEDCGICDPSFVCTATANTSGVPGRCTLAGSPVPANNNLTLRASQLPTVPSGVFGIFLHGLSEISSTPIPAGQGVLCIGNAGRFNAPNQIKQANANGVAELSTLTGEFTLPALPVAQAPFVFAATAGTTSYFTFWHRDFVNPSSTAFNFASAVGVVWQ